MAEVRVVPFPVFRISRDSFWSGDPSWSFAYGNRHELVAVGANYTDEEGVALKVESIAPQAPLRSRISRQPIGFAVARAGSASATGRRELAALMRHAREAKEYAVELALEIDVEGDQVVVSALGYEAYVAGTVEIGGQRVTVSGRALEVPVRLRRRRSPLPVQTPGTAQE